MSDSVLLRLVRAMDDTWFVQRVSVAVELAGGTPERDVLLAVARRVAGQVTLTGSSMEGWVVDTSGVSDESIIQAVSDVLTSTAGDTGGDA